MMTEVLEKLLQTSSLAKITHKHNFQSGQQIKLLEE